MFGLFYPETNARHTFKDFGSPLEAEEYMYHLKDYVKDVARGNADLAAWMNMYTGDIVVLREITQGTNV